MSLAVAAKGEGNVTAQGPPPVLLSKKGRKEAAFEFAYGLFLALFPGRNLIHPTALTAKI